MWCTFPLSQNQIKIFEREVMNGEVHIAGIIKRLIEGGAVPIVYDKSNANERSCIHDAFSTWELCTV